MTSTAMIIRFTGSISRLQRGNFQSGTEEACSNHFSLWTAREGDHVFGQCLVYVDWSILHNSLGKSQGNFIRYMDGLGRACDCCGFLGLSWCHPSRFTGQQCTFLELIRTITAIYSQTSTFLGLVRTITTIYSQASTFLGLIRTLHHHLLTNKHIFRPSSLHPPSFAHQQAQFED